MQAAFCDWHVPTIAAMGERELDALMQNAALIRNRRKLEAIVHNARQTMSLPKQSLAPLLLSFLDNEQPICVPVQVEFSFLVFFFNCILF